MAVRETTKCCPNCGNTNLVLIGTQNAKFCPDCYDTNADGTRTQRKIDWYVEEGQAPIYGGPLKGKSSDN